MNLILSMFSAFMLGMSVLFLNVGMMETTDWLFLSLSGGFFVVGLSLFKQSIVRCFE